MLGNHHAHNAAETGINLKHKQNQNMRIVISFPMIRYMDLYQCKDKNLPKSIGSFCVYESEESTSSVLPPPVIHTNSLVDA